MIQLEPRHLHGRAWPIWVTLACLSTVAPRVGAQESEPAAETRSGYQEIPKFGGPSSTPEQLERDDEIKPSAMRFDTLQRWAEPYFDFKSRLQRDHGLSLGLDYTAVLQGATASPGEDFAAGGIFRLFGSWTAFGRGQANNGSIVFKIESRHRLGTSIPPSGLGFEAGYVGLTAAPYNDGGWWLTNLYWQQKTNDGRLNYVAGQVDPTDYLDIYGLVNPWTAFMNLALITGSGTMPLPNQGLGAAGGAMLGDNVYVVAGLVDSNGDPGDPLEGFDSFFGDRESFKHLEIGWTPSFERRYLDNAHVTLWHADEREAAGVPSGWGAAFSYARFLNDEWMPFVRGGWADDGGALLERSLSVGFGRYAARRRDLLGVGLNWGKPSEDFGPDPSDQYTVETFYRLQFSENFALTPDVQLVFDPALAPEEDFTAILGLRARLSL